MSPGTTAAALAREAAKDPRLSHLNARAKMDLAPWKKEREFFLNYDAWCDPRFRRHLVEGGPALKEHAKRFYRVDQPPPLVHEEALLCAFQLFEDLPFNRATYAVRGKEYGIALRLARRERKALKDAKLTLAKMVREVAGLQFALFSRHFPQKDKRAPSRALLLAFVRFATGQLRLQAGLLTQLNAEPDSHFFFQFAEFCIQAAHFGAAPSKAWWTRLAALFALLDDAYCFRYHQVGGRRVRDAYADALFNRSRPTTEKFARTIVALAQSRSRTLEEVVERVTWSACWAFHDEVA